MIEINGIISSYVEVEQQPVTTGGESRRFDISAIDFDMLRREFAKVKNKNLVMKDLDEAIRQKLANMLFANPDRINYYERYQKIIEEYNSEQDRATIEKTFMELMNLANSLNQEEQRYVREGFSSDEELELIKKAEKSDLANSLTMKQKQLEMLKELHSAALREGKESDCEVIKDSIELLNSDAFKELIELLIISLVSFAGSYVMTNVVSDVCVDYLIVVDALASRSIARVNKTIQVTNTGISPGSGVGNKRKELSKETIGLPVIAIGVPTVVDAVTIASDTIDYLLKYFNVKINNTWRY